MTRNPNAESLFVITAATTTGSALAILECSGTILIQWRLPHAGSKPLGALRRLETVG
jgi:hypothetical protein